MLKAIIFTTMLICLRFLSYSQATNQTTEAHFRSYCLHIDPYFDTRVPSLFLKPELHLRFLDGLIDIKGQMPIELIQFEDLYYVANGTDFLGDNLNRKKKMHEVQFGINFYGRLNSNANLLFSRTMGNWTTSWSTDGSRASLFGAHVGHGGFVSNTRMTDLFEVYDINGNKFNLENNNLPSGLTRHEILTNTIVEYIFLGPHLYQCKKPSSSYEKVRGGTNTSYSFDLILPTRVWVGDVYSREGEKYTLKPKSGHNWNKMGFRFVVDRTFTSSLFLNYRFEFGKMTNFSLSQTFTNSPYMAFSIGMSIQPKLGFITPKEIGSD